MTNEEARTLSWWLARVTPEGVVEEIKFENNYLNTGGHDRNLPRGYSENHQRDPHQLLIAATDELDAYKVVVAWVAEGMPYRNPVHVNWSEATPEQRGRVKEPEGAGA